MIYLGNSSEKEDIEKKYIAFLEKLKPYFEKYGYTYDDRWDGFTNSPETNDGLFRYGSQMDSDYMPKLKILKIKERIKDLEKDFEK